MWMTSFWCTPVGAGKSDASTSVRSTPPTIQLNKTAPVLAVVESISTKRLPKLVRNKWLHSLLIRNAPKVPQLGSFGTLHHAWSPTAMGALQRGARALHRHAPPGCAQVAQNLPWMWAQTTQAQQSWLGNTTTRLSCQMKQQ